METSNTTASRGASAPPTTTTTPAGGGGPGGAPPGRIIIMCAIQKRQLCQFDQARLADAEIEPEMLALLAHNVLWLYCKHCRHAHRVDFAALLSAPAGERFFWIGGRGDVPAPLPAAL